MFRGCLWRAIHIPKEKIMITKSRASGPGGQNIQASNSKVQLRFETSNASWLPVNVLEDVRKRFGKAVVISCQESRSCIDNEKHAFLKLQALLDSIEENLNKPTPGFESVQEYIASVRTDKQIARYKINRENFKKREAQERRRRNDKTD